MNGYMNVLTHYDCLNNGEPGADPVVQIRMVLLQHLFGRSCAYPSATSSTIIREKPTAKASVPMLECSPSDISGISSSTTT